ncbi:MAG: amidohydrolase [Chlorobi bacterium]|nr:amidohydrolase [Chlorobiota bacterium]
MELNITCIQPDVVWEDREANFHHLSDLLKPLAGKTDLVILPEMFSTGFTMQPEKITDIGDDGDLQWMIRQSGKLDAAVTGSFIAPVEGSYRNRLAFVTPDGQTSFYDKRHLFRMGEENQHYTPGNKIVDVSWKSWQIKPLICYDLRFPVWIRSGTRPDLLIFIANWPASRREVWLTLLKARAIENQVYTIGVNRVGTDGRKISYSGDTTVLDPKGNILKSAPSGQESVLRVLLDKTEQDLFREKFPVHLDADRFQIFT